MRPRTDDEILEDLKDWPVRNIYVERGVRLIDQLRQRVAELEEDRDRWRADCQTYCDAMHKREEAITSLQAERDKVTQYWQIAEGRCDALIKQRDDLLAALKVALKQLEEWEVKIDSEFGDCRQLDAIDAAGDLSEATVAVRSAIASVKEK